MKFNFDFQNKYSQFVIGLFILGVILSGSVIAGFMEDPEEATDAAERASKPTSSTPSASAVVNIVDPEERTPTIYLPALVVAPTTTPAPRPVTALPAVPASVDVKIVGPEEVVFDWSEDACEPSNIPDGPARAFRDAGGRVQLLLSHYRNYRMIGSDLDHLAIDCNVIMSSDFDADPAKFNDREWIRSLYTLDGIRVYALIHNEYQGHRHAGRCPSQEYFPCWYNAVTLATSTNGGVSFVQYQSPDHFVAGVPYLYEPDVGPFGIFAPSNIVYNGADEYYYVLLRSEAFRDQSRGTCVMRTRNLADPRAWQVWDGTSFNGKFINPYGGSNIDAADYICQPAASKEIQKMHESVTYNTYLDHFLLVGIAGEYSPIGGEVVWGIYYSLSQDLVHWTPRELILEIEVPWNYQCGDADPVLYPSLLDSSSKSRNFETTASRAYLYFTRFNYINCLQNLDRDLIRIPIELVR